MHTHTVAYTTLYLGHCREGIMSDLNVYTVLCLASSASVFFTPHVMSGLAIYW